MPKDKNLIISNKNDGSSSDAVSDSTVKAFSFNDDVLKLFNIKESQVEEFKISSEKDELHVQITLNRGDCSCPMCRSEEIKVKGYKIKKVRHSVLAHAPCIIDYKQRRFECKNCGKTFNEENPFTFPGEKVSVTTVFLVLKDLRDPNETFTSVANRYFLSPTTVQRIFDAHVNIPRKKLTKYLVMDETYSFHSSQGDYVYVLMDFETLAIIDILPTRKKDDLQNYFSKIPKDERDQVRMTSSDMWETYRSVSKQFFPNSKHVVDTFHLKAELSRKLQDVRIRVMKDNYVKKKKPEEIKAMSPQEQEEYEHKIINYYLLKKFKWMFYKRPDDKCFDPNNEKKYNKVFKRYLNYYEIYYMILDIDDELREAVALQECLYAFFRKNDLKTAAKALKELITNFHASQVKEMNDFANTLANWKQEILNYFEPVQIGEEFIIDDDLNNAETELIKNFIAKNRQKKTRRMNSSVIENRNRIIQSIKCCANGYSNWSRFRNRVLYCLGMDTSFFLEPQPISRDRINDKGSRSKR